MAAVYGVCRGLRYFERRIGFWFVFCVRIVESGLSRVEQKIGRGFWFLSKSSEFSKEWPRVFFFFGIKTGRGD